MRSRGLYCRQNRGKSLYVLFTHRGRPRWCIIAAPLVMTTAMKILIIGGYGIFGARLVELLKNEPRLTLFVGGRSGAKATSFITTRIGARARLVSAPFDRDGDLAAALRRRDVLASCAGAIRSRGSPPRWSAFRRALPTRRSASNSKSRAMGKSGAAILAVNISRATSPRAADDQID